MVGFYPLLSKQAERPSLYALLPAFLDTLVSAQHEERFHHTYPSASFVDGRQALHMFNLSAILQANLRPLSSSKRMSLDMVKQSLTTPP